MNPKELARMAGKWSGAKKRPAPPDPEEAGETAPDNEAAEKHGDGHQCGGDCPMMKKLKARGIL